MGRISSDASLLSDAESALKKLSYVGFFDHLPKVVRDLCAVAQVTPPTELPHSNSAVRKPISKADLATIAEYNSIDIALYENALRRRSAALPA